MPKWLVFLISIITSTTLMFAAYLMGVLDSSITYWILLLVIYALKFFRKQRE